MPERHLHARALRMRVQAIEQSGAHSVQVRTQHVLSMADFVRRCVDDESCQNECRRCLPLVVEASVRLTCKSNSAQSPAGAHAHKERVRALQNSPLYTFELVASLVALEGAQTQPGQEECGSLDAW
jgi:hypothetical protein